MITKEYYNEELDSKISVEEMSRTEAVQYIKDWVDGISNAPYSTDLSVYVKYTDGSSYINIDGDVSGKLKFRGIKGCILDDGYEYYIYGQYEMADSLIPELVD